MQMDNCCTCGGGTPPDIQAVRVYSKHRWPGVSPNNAWSVGSWAWPADGDRAITVQNLYFASVHTTGLGFSDEAGIGPGGDYYAQSRYLQIVLSASGTDRSRSGTSSYSVTKVWDKDTGALVSVAKTGTDKYGTGYSYTWAVSTTGVVTETGADGFADTCCPVTSIIEVGYDDPAHFSMTVDVTATVATHVFMYDGSDGLGPITVTRTATKSDVYTLGDIVGDAQAMLGDIDLSSLATTYTIDGVPGRTLGYGAAVTIWWQQQSDGVAKARLISYGVLVFLVGVASVDPSAITACGTLYLEVVAEKSLVLCAADQDLVMVELTPAHESTLFPPGLDSADWAESGATDCAAGFFPAGVPTQVGPGDISFTYGAGGIGTC